MDKQTDVSYMQDMYPDIPNIENAHFKNSDKFDQRTVNGQAYLDPDGHCLRLYEDEIRTFFGADNAQVSLSDKGNQYIVNHKIPGLETPVVLSSDYLGPSSTAAFHAGLDDDYVWETIIKCRTIGGHMLWPRMQNGINPKKAQSGNKNAGISDRMDIALYELRNYLKGEKTADRINTEIWKAFENPINDTWLRSFDATGERPFEAFCDFFKLKGSFVDDDHEVIWLAPKVMGKASKEDVMSFFKENVDAIERRNKKIDMEKNMGR